MKLRIWLVLFMVPLFFAGCGTLTHYKKIDNFMLSGKYGAADKTLTAEKKQYKGEHELLYYFDKGTILQALGEYDSSAAYLNKAELKIESLYTKSVTKHVSSFLTNDMNLPYEGEEFEQVMVHIIKALNFLYKGDFNGAQVEARKADHRLNLLVDRYEGKPIYQEDAMARYLGGLAYEAAGELDHARIDYKKSYRAYAKYRKMYGTSVPKRVKKDLLRILEALGYREDLAEYRKKWGNISFTNYRKLRRQSELIVVVYDGLAPYKVSKYIKSPVKDKKGNVHMIRVAFPYFKKRGYVVSGAVLESGGASVRSFIAEDITKIAVKNLEHKNALIKAKAVARAAAKYFAGRAVSNDGKNKLLGMLADIYSWASEKADTRSWRTLPARFHIIRAKLKPGTHRVKVNLSLIGGGSRQEVIEVKLKRGQKKVVPVYAFN